MSSPSLCFSAGAVALRVDADAVIVDKVDVDPKLDVRWKSLPPPAPPPTALAFDLLPPLPASLLMDDVVPTTLEVVELLAPLLLGIPKKNRPMMSDASSVKDRMVGELGLFLLLFVEVIVAAPPPPPPPTRELRRDELLLSFSSTSPSLLSSSSITVYGVGKFVPYSCVGSNKEI